mgnify:CR=1 FL=1
MTFCANRILTVFAGLFIAGALNVSSWAEEVGDTAAASWGRRSLDVGETEEVGSACHHRRSWTL